MTRLPLIALLIVAAVLPWYVQPSIYWRDGPEFVLSGIFLDISHPPGSPTYAQLIHPLTWIPIGPLAARVSLGSALIVLALLAQIALIARAAGVSSGMAAFATLLALWMPGVLHQALTAEVYALSAVFILGMIQLLVAFERSDDRRYLLAIAFLGGLGAGVHLIVPILASVFASIALAYSKGRLIGLLPSAIFVGLVGLLTYGYLPARALTHPPLNTGAPLNGERFLAQVTDARDRELRAKGGFESIHFSGHQVVQDTVRFADHVGWIFLFVSSLGIITLAIQRSLLGFALIGVTATVGAIFAGWDFAPWTIVSAALAVGCALGLQKTGEWAQQGSVRWILFPVMLGVIGQNGRHSPLLAIELSTYDAPEQAALQTLTAVPRNGDALVEQSIFATTYLQAVENVRPDTRILYQPALEWPSYFRPEHNRQGAQISKLTEFLQAQPEGVVIPFEPSPMTANILSKVARCDPLLGWHVQRPQAALVHPECGASVLSRINDRGSRSPELAEDEEHNRELAVLGSATLLAKMGEWEHAREIVAKLCARFPCSRQAQSAAKYLESNRL